MQSGSVFAICDVLLIPRSNVIEQACFLDILEENVRFVPQSSRMASLSSLISSLCQ